MSSRLPRPWITALLGAVVLVLVGLVGAGALWHHEGGRWYVVTSASMGETMPTGTLVLTRPTTAAATNDGDIITFRSPGTRVVFSHRVVDRSSTGLTTRGDVNFVDDAWTVTDADLIGEVVWRAPALGWALRGVPLLALGLLVTWLVTALLRPAQRFGARLIGTSITFAVVNWFLHPWVGLDQLAQTTPDDGSPGVLMQLISTGLLPTQAFEIDGGARASLHNGEVGTLHLTHASDGRYGVAARLDLAWWGWVLLAVVVLTPLLFSLLRGMPPELAPQDLEDPDDQVKVAPASVSPVPDHVVGLTGMLR